MQSASAPSGRLGRKSFRGLYSRSGAQLRGLIKKGGKQETLSSLVISIVFLFPPFLVPIFAPCPTCRSREKLRTNRTRLPHSLPESPRSLRGDSFPFIGNCSRLFQPLRFLRTVLFGRRSS